MWASSGYRRAGTRVGRRAGGPTCRPGERSPSAPTMAPIRSGRHPRIRPLLDEGDSRIIRSPLQPGQAGPRSMRWPGGRAAPIIGPMEGFVTAREVAERLGVAPDTVTRWCREGRIPAVRPGRDWRIPASVIE
ncbi:MAG TPA: helix-turn-helix domain-containing protein, partial [Actinomycetota bacterium]|nr:helix-turn-helix domain-containing protein [Actinomycetota bacterium]